MNEEILEIKRDIHEKYGELMNQTVDINKTISGVLDLIDAMREEMVSLRTDVDKLIENNQGGKRYGKSA